MDYVNKKIAHMKRLGLVAGASNGRGPNGGACPDWLKAEKKKAEEPRIDRVYRKMLYAD